MRLTTIDSLVSRPARPDRSFRVGFELLIPNVQLRSVVLDSIFLSDSESPMVPFAVLSARDERSVFRSGFCECGGNALPLPGSLTGLSFNASRPPNRGRLPFSISWILTLASAGSSRQPLN